MPQDSLEESFSDTFVMAKILEIPEQEDDLNSDEMERLRKDIVRYNNSQNSIDEKTFTAVMDEFALLQREFLKHGFLLLLKQSDLNKFLQLYKKPTELLEKSQKKLETFGLEGSLSKTRDFTIPLAKLLQVVIAFFGDSQQAFQKKGRLLNTKSAQYKTVTEAIKNPELTIQRLLSLYLLSLRAEKTKNSDSGDGKTPIPWHLIEGISKIEGAGDDLSKLDKMLNDKNTINGLIETYKKASRMYLNMYKRNNPDKDYNAMIKDKLDVDIFRDCVEIVK